MISRVLPIVAVALATALAGVARADDVTAEQHYQNGQDAYHAAKYKQAITEWEASYAQSHEPDLLFDLGQAARLDEDCGLALRYYSEYLRQPNADPDRAKPAVDFVMEMQRCVDVKQTAKALAEVKPPPAPPPIIVPSRAMPGRGKRMSGVLIGAGGAALMVVGALFAASSNEAADAVHAACARSCDWSVESGRDADGRRDAELAWAFTGVGAAAAIAGGVIYWLGVREEEGAPHAMVVPAGGGVAAVVSWRW